MTCSKTQPRRQANRRFVLLAMVACLAYFCFSPTHAVAYGGYAHPAILAHGILDASPEDAALRAQSLRVYGEAALEALRKTYPNELQELKSRFLAGTPLSERLQRLRDVWRRVCAQEHAFLCELYWHTNLDAALAEARKTKKPVLSLRLLGHLDEELSCANSRFFRALLYPDPRVNRVLRNYYVLHWESVRKVPCVRLDFGDGRVVERTIAGNSIHYLLGMDGQVLDGLPGLYSPLTFTRALNRWRPMCRRYNNSPSLKRSQSRDSALAQWHTSQDHEIRRAWDHALKMRERAAQQKIAAQESTARRTTDQAPYVDAFVPEPLTVSKSMTERRLLRSLLPELAELEERSSEALWEFVAEWPMYRTELCEASLRLVAEMHEEDNADVVLKNLIQSVSLDTVKNHFGMRRTLHEWLSKSDADRDEEALTQRVYADMFLTPLDDPYLGLIPRDRFAALPMPAAKPRNSEPNPTPVSEGGSARR